MYNTAGIVLAAGHGKRMGASIPKQFTEINGKPVFIFSILKMLEFTDYLVLVTSPEYMAFCRETLEKYGLSERVAVIEGGKERYESAIAGLEYLKENGGCTYVLIHDSARACVTRGIIETVLSDTVKYRAAVAAVPSVDTVKEGDADGFAVKTLDRRRLYSIQTPQGFEFSLIYLAYKELQKAGTEVKSQVTDDASVIELFTGTKVKLSKGDGDNFKITNPGDFERAALILEKES